MGAGTKVGQREKRVAAAVKALKAEPLTLPAAPRDADVVGMVLLADGRLQPVSSERFSPAWMKAWEDIDESDYEVIELLLGSDAAQATMKRFQGKLDALRKRSVRRRAAKATKVESAARRDSMTLLGSLVGHGRRRDLLCDLCGELAGAGMRPAEIARLLSALKLEELSNPPDSSWQRIKKRIQRYRKRVDVDVT